MRERFLLIIAILNSLSHTNNPSFYTFTSNQRRRLLEATLLIFCLCFISPPPRIIAFYTRVLIEHPGKPANSARSPLILVNHLPTIKDHSHNTSYRKSDALFGCSSSNIPAEQIYMWYVTLILTSIFLTLTCGKTFDKGPWRVKVKLIISLRRSIATSSVLSYGILMWGLRLYLDWVRWDLA